MSLFREKKVFSLEYLANNPMYKRFLIIFICVFFIGLEDIFACQWWQVTIPTFSELQKSLWTTPRENALKCIDAYSKKKETSITNFSCPSGDFSSVTGLPLTRESLAYQVAVATAFAEIDTKVESYMRELQDCRQKDSVLWTEDIREKISGKWDKSGFADLYTQVCDLTNIQLIVWDTLPENKEKLIQTTHVFPIDACRQKAIQKTIAWTNMGYILMGDNIAKSYENDKDTFAEKVKWAYAKLLNLFSYYRNTVSRALAKLNALTKDTIQ